MRRKMTHYSSIVSLTVARFSDVHAHWKILDMAVNPGMRVVEKQIRWMKVSCASFSTM